MMMDHQQFCLDEQEVAALSTQEVLDSHVDALGINLGLELINTRGDGGETVAVVREASVAKLAALETEIDNIPREEKAAFLEARARCPDLVDGVHLTEFLKRDDFDVKLAARRLVDYWDIKREGFGPEKCYLPLTLTGALKDDLAVLSSGFVSLLPFKDEAGRAIIFFDIGRFDPSAHSMQSMLRASWYTIHIANEDSDVLERGYVSLSTSQHTLSHRPAAENVQLARAFMNLRRMLPFQHRASHICHPNKLTLVILDILPTFDTWFKMRLRVHSGSTEDILRKLEGYRIPRKCVPSVLGGGVEIDQNKWLVERLAHEVSLQTMSQTNRTTAAPSSSAQVSYYSTGDSSGYCTAATNEGATADLGALVNPSADHASLASTHPATNVDRGQPSSSATQSPRILLCSPEDRVHLTEQLCLLREQIEVFPATAEDALARGQRGGRTCKIVCGRIGLRCSHCAHLPLHKRGKGAVVYPQSIDHVYQSVRNFRRDHVRVCQCIPPDVREKILTCERKNSAGQVKSYFSSSCAHMGLVNAADMDGIRFARSCPTAEVRAPCTVVAN